MKWTSDFASRILDPVILEELRLRLQKTGGHLPSKIGQTATTVRSNDGSRVSGSRRSRDGVFVIPRVRNRDRNTTTGSGVNIPQSPGLNLVI